MSKLNAVLLDFFSHIESKYSINFNLSDEWNMWNSFDDLLENHEKNMYNIKETPTVYVKSDDTSSITDINRCKYVGKRGNNKGVRCSRNVSKQSKQGYCCTHMTSENNDQDSVSSSNKSSKCTIKTTKNQKLNVLTINNDFVWDPQKKMVTGRIKNGEIDKLDPTDVEECGTLTKQYGKKLKIDEEAIK